jgi:uncharacterized protein with PQ loop repeat
VIASRPPAADGRHVLAVLSVVATVSGLTAGCLPSLQVAKMWRERSAEGMSLPWLLGALTNSAIWNCYSILLGNMALILPNALNLAMNVSLTTSVLVLRHRARTAAPVPTPFARVAKAVVDDPELAAEFAALVAGHRQRRLSEADTLVLRLGEIPALSA